MKTVILFFLFTITPLITTGQTRVHGLITDKKNPIPGASISIKNTYEGASADETGAYSFTTHLTGSHLLVFQAIGYKTVEKAVILGETALEIDAQLQETINALQAVTITAGALEASDSKKNVVLKPLDIYTTPAASGDITAALQTLPGTATVGNDGRLFVRGGDASETAIYIDGLLVGNAYGSRTANVPTRNRFSPELFKGTFFSTGGYSAEYGQALSSALNLNTVDLPAQTQGDLNIMSLGAGYSQTVVKKDLAAVVSANYFNLAPYQNLVKQNFDWDKSPRGWDSDFTLHKKTVREGFLKGYFHAEGGTMKIWQREPGSDSRGQLVGLSNQYLHSNLSIRQPLTKGWLLNGGFAYSRNRDHVTTDTLAIYQTNLVSHAKIALSKDWGNRFTLKQGLDWFHKKYSEELVVSKLGRELDDDQFNYYIEGDYYLSNSLVLRGGLRAGYSSRAQQSWLTPRISLARRIGAGQLSLAYGQFRQLPEERLRVLAPYLHNTRATHYLVNYIVVSNNRTLRAEVFYKAYDQLVTFKGTSTYPVQVSQNGNGYARGFDVFFRDRKTLKGTDFWITYSFIQSKRLFDTYTVQVQPHYAPTHNASIVAKHFIGALRSQIGGSWSWNSGYPYFNPNSPQYGSALTRSYSSVAFSWSYLPKPNMIIHAACTNVFGTDNVFGYTYASTPDASGHFASLPNGQGARRFAMLGLFITFSKDKNKNYLNNL